MSPNIDRWPQVSPYDVLPKFICHICYNKTVAFHEFYTQAHIAQDNFLAKPKDARPPIMADVDHLKPEPMQPDDDFIDIFKDDGAHDDDNYSRSGYESSFSAESATFDVKPPAPLRPTPHPSATAPLDTAVVQAVIAAHFEPTCELCPMELGTLRRAIEHYRSDHKIGDGFLKCCGKRLKTPKSVQSHVRVHLDAKLPPCADETASPATAAGRRFGEPAETTAAKSSAQKVSKTAAKKPPQLSAKKPLKPTAQKSALETKKVVEKSAATALRAQLADAGVRRQYASFRRRCAYCPYQLHRKVQTLCDICDKFSCKDHAMHTIKCYECRDRPTIISAMPAQASRRRCAVCKPKVDRKVRQVCFCCLKPVCGSHAVETHTCQQCVGGGAAEEVVEGQSAMELELELDENEGDIC